MAPKRRKQTSSDQENMFVVLRDSKTSSSHVISVNQLSYLKKDNLKIGSSATFKGAGDAPCRFQGIVLAKGTKQQCEQSLSMIEKSNSKSTKVSDKPDSDSSDHLQIDERTVASDSDENNSKEPDEEMECETPLSISKESNVVVNKNKNPTISSQIYGNNSSSLTATTDMTTSSDVVLKDITNTADGNNKKKDTPIESRSISIKKKKRSSVITHSDFEKVLRVNAQLKKELDMYKTNWMPRPTGAAVGYFIEVGKVLSSASTREEEENKGEKLENICIALGMNEKELKTCEHLTDITKTCRQIIKYLYRDSKERARMLVSSMNDNILHSIQEYARMAHPALSKTSNSTLNNAIGNVFATEKRKLERNEEDVLLANEVDDDEEDDEDL